MKALISVTVSGWLAILASCTPDPPAVQGRGADTANWWDALPRSEWRRYDRVDVDDDWFEVYRILDGVFAIYEPGQFEEVISFLITGERFALLFDTGLGIGDMRGVIDRLTDLNVVVLNSHTHYDHIGGNHAFGTIYALDSDFTRAHARGLSHEQLAEFVGEGWIWKPLPEKFARDEYRTHPFSISRFIGEGEIIDLGGRRLEVLETPGHAPDAVCLIDRENRLLFTGDTFYLAPLYAHLPESDFDDYAETAARLAALTTEVDLLITSHNVPIADARYLTALGVAFETISAGGGEYELTDGNREYRFDGFSVIVNGR